MGFYFLVKFFFDFRFVLDDFLFFLDFIGESDNNFKVLRENLSDEFDSIFNLANGFADFYVFLAIGGETLGLERGNFQGYFVVFHLVVS